MKFHRRIIRIIQWLPILWRDRDWDQEYLWVIMEFKMRQMIAFFEGSETHTVGSKKQARRMRVFLGHLDRVRNSTQYYDYDFPDRVERCCEDENFIEWVFASKADEEKARRVSEKINAGETWNWEQAWKLMDKHARSWWD